MDRYIQRSSSTSSLKRAADGEAGWTAPKKTAPQRDQSKYDDNRGLPINNRYDELNVDTEDNEAKKIFQDASNTIKKSGHIPPIILDIKPDWTHNSIQELVSKHSKRFHLLL
ncbi:hypothetical protein O0L34_g12982 [Tuta absoluta]|nr:hypothetical protein O0L34_g12982 [Tuta absoluta]